MISHALWLYHRFPLSYREVEKLLFERDITVTYESIRAWCATSGPAYARQLRRRQPRPGDKWYMDEVFIKVNGQKGDECEAPARHGRSSQVPCVGYGSPGRISRRGYCRRR
ncbi:hypothetical protein [Streptomyces sp. AK02-04a]|uniref:hypothetical protein n=1 Tax=Streptomyces sp. AK02-04a TaxID=3028649 RepID=UPI0029C9E90E|nr:hypothetical protein [Streptomyces sp. AK02-04a]